MDDVETRVRPTKRASFAAVAARARESLFPFSLSLFPAVASARANPEANALRREKSAFAFQQAWNVSCFRKLDISRTDSKEDEVCGKESADAYHPTRSVPRV